MNLFFRLAGGRQVYLEYARWAQPDRWLLARREGAELILWLGRLQIIYTPPARSARWRADDGRHPLGP